VMGCLRGGEAPSFQYPSPSPSQGEGDKGGEVDEQYKQTLT